MSAPPYAPSLLDRAVSVVSPVRGLRRIQAAATLHHYRYNGAQASHKRASAPANMSPNSFDVQRDRLQLMREGEDLERNFPPAAMLNRKYAMYACPISYHAQTGDKELDKEVEEYLSLDAFQNCDSTGRYDFYKMLEFGIMGCNRSGDYGWAFLREGLEEGMSEEEVVKLPLRIQAVEPDRIGGVYQNTVADDYVSGLIIGEMGKVDAFRVFHRGMATNQYIDPVDVPAKDFVHLTDPLRIDQYRGVSRLAAGIEAARDLYEMIEFVKGKAKLASALTIFTNSNGAQVGSQSMDPYATNMPGESSAVLQQDIKYGQINHLTAGADIKFPSSNSPSSEEQALITLLLKMLAMCYNLPFSFALDAAALGGVSSRLESEMAKAEFERFQRVISRSATRMKNVLLLDAVAKGIFPADKIRIITRGRWGFRKHPQPDIGKEANAAVNLYEHGLLNPMSHFVDNGEDPETVAADMTRWAMIKRDAAAGAGMDVAEIFGTGPARPVSITESTTNDETPGGNQGGSSE